MISYYDHKTHKVPKPVIVYDKAGVDDPHDDAALSIDNDGFIWVFVSGRNQVRPGLLFKSQKPYSIDSFDKILDGEMTYPQPWWLMGEDFYICLLNIRERKIGRGNYSGRRVQMVSTGHPIRNLQVWEVITR